MRPDGEGTDTRDIPDISGSRRQRHKSTNSIERDIIMLAVGFVVLALIICGAVWLSKRSYLTTESSTDPTLQQAS